MDASVNQEAAAATHQCGSRRHAGQGQRVGNVLQAAASEAVPADAAQQIGYLALVVTRAPAGRF